MIITLAATFFQCRYLKADGVRMFDKREDPGIFLASVYWDIMWYNVVTCLDWKIYQSLQKTITNGHLVLHSCWSPWPRTGLPLVRQAWCETTATLMDRKHHCKNVSWVLFSFQITSNQTTSPHFLTYSEASWIYFTSSTNWERQRERQREELHSS